MYIRVRFVHSFRTPQSSKSQCQVKCQSWTPDSELRDASSKKTTGGCAKEIHHSDLHLTHRPPKGDPRRGLRKRGHVLSDLKVI